MSFTALVITGITIWLGIGVCLAIVFVLTAATVPKDSRYVTTEPNYPVIFLVVLLFWPLGALLGPAEMVLRQVKEFFGWDKRRIFPEGKNRQ